MVLFAKSIMTAPRFSWVAPISIANITHRLKGHTQTRTTYTTKATLTGRNNNIRPLRIPQSHPEPSPSPKQEIFDWYEQWYPLAITEDLCKHQPTPIKILDIDLVIWYSVKSSSWTVFQDRCPHRHAALSQGVCIFTCTS